jgi:uncharacterized lipoprotein YehR (DUF1307 family)
MKKLRFALLLLLLALAACSPAASRPSQGSQGGPEAPGANSSSISAGPELSTGKASDTTDQTTDRKVVATAQMSIAVNDPAQALQSITALATGTGGFVVNSNLQKVTSSSGKEYPAASITVRVPASKLQEAMEKVRGLVPDRSTDILTEATNSQDITKEYVDLTARLKNLQAAEEQLRKMMDQATKSEDVLAIFEQLTSIRQQIEQVQGQIRYYDESVDLSALSVDIQAKESIQPVQIGGWQPTGIARDALQALINALQGIGTALIWLVIVFVPVGAILFFPGRALWRLIRRRSRNKPGQPSA